MSQKLINYDLHPMKDTVSELSESQYWKSISLCAGTFICIPRTPVCLGSPQAVCVFFLSEL